MGETFTRLVTLPQLQAAFSSVDGKISDVSEAQQVDATAITALQTSKLGATSPGDQLTVIPGSGSNRAGLSALFGRWVFAEDFGAKGDGLTNDSPAFAKAASALSSAGGGTILYRGRSLLGDSLTLPRGVTLRGPTDHGDPGNDWTGRVGFYAFLQAVPCIIVSPSASIVVQGGQSIRGNYIMRQGLKLDGTDASASYAGTAITGNYTDAVTVDDCSILGFNQAIDFRNMSRCRYSNLLIDSQNGIKETTTADISRLSHVTCYNVLQGNASGNDSSTLRTGNAFWFAGTNNGGAELLGCFSYGYTNGVRTETSGSYDMVNVWIDGPTDATTGRPLNPDCVGFNLLADTSSGTSDAEPMLVGCRAASQGTGVFIGEDTFGAAQIIAFQAWNCLDGINTSCNLNTLNGVSIRSYFSRGLVFGTPVAAYQAKVSGLNFYSRQPSATADIECAQAQPPLDGVNYQGGDLLLTNTVGNTSFCANGVVNIAYNRSQFLVWPSNGSTGEAITDITPHIIGRIIDVTFATDGFSIASGSNFRLQSAMSGVTGSSIRLVYYNGVWNEMSRSSFS